jgi:hypothetical protein
LGWEDRYQCGVGATADIAGLTPFVSAQMFSTAVGLQQYGAGDIHKQTDAIAEQGIREVGGALTVLGSSLAHGVGNDGKAGYKMAESTVGTAGEIVDWGLENARPASIEEAVARANSGCLTHASHKADLNKFATPILLLKSSKYPKLRPHGRPDVRSLVRNLH